MQINVKNNALITGFWLGSMHLGNFVGPTVAGFLVEAMGFRQSTLYFQILYAILCVSDSLELAWHIKRAKKDENENGIEFHMVLPSLGEVDKERRSIDFNDVLKELGPEALYDQLTPK